MAYVNSASISFFDGLNASDRRAWLRDWLSTNHSLRARQKMMWELQMMSDVELHELGLSRDTIARRVFGTRMGL
ncbi:MAG: hypothetical protein AAFR93_14855 [Pseudomonadota bacterium]